MERWSYSRSDKESHERGMLNEGEVLGEPALFHFVFETQCRQVAVQQRLISFMKQKWGSPIEDSGNAVFTGLEG